MPKMINGEFRWSVYVDIVDDKTGDIYIHELFFSTWNEAVATVENIGYQQYYGTT